MVATSKASVTRRKSGKGLIVTLHVSAQQLKDILEPETTKMEESPPAEAPEAQEKEDVKETEEVKENANEPPSSPANSGTPAAPAAPNGDNASDSTPATPAINGEGTPGAMGPPADGTKKKGTKRSAATANGVGPDGQPKARGKPGPKKKARLDDGAEANGRGAGGHKLGPKANQGAINAGLRALDRSGKPCRKWARGGFRLKSFTGVVWEVPRWTAPPKIVPESTPEDSAAAASADSSNKEDKEENSQMKSDVNSPAPGNSIANSTAADVEMRSGPGSAVNASSPAPMPTATAA